MDRRTLFVNIASLTLIGTGMALMVRGIVGLIKVAKYKKMTPEEKFDFFLKNKQLRALIEEAKHNCENNFIAPFIFKKRAVGYSDEEIIAAYNDHVLEVAATTMPHLTEALSDAGFSAEEISYFAMRINKMVLPDIRDYLN